MVQGAWDPARVAGCWGHPDKPVGRVASLRRCQSLKDKLQDRLQRKKSASCNACTHMSFCHPGTHSATCAANAPRMLDLQHGLQ